MKVLLISNSFGVNLQTYARDIATENNLSLEIFTLYIGGCSLDTHEKNIKENNPLYELFVNGKTTEKFVSIHDALHCDEFDIISLQQASHYSGLIETYYPHFEFVYNYVKHECPNSKIIFHQTWAYSGYNTYKYDTTSSIAANFKFKNDVEMKKGIDECLNKICSEFKLYKVIKSGDVVELAMEKFGNVYDDMGFHMNNIGCYLIGLNLVKTLFDKPIEKVFVPFGIGAETCQRAVDFINSNF